MGSDFTSVQTVLLDKFGSESIQFTYITLLHEGVQLGTDV
jgi:hypothetical protein